MTYSLRAWSNATDSVKTVLWRGTVIEANGQWIKALGPVCQIGEMCELRSNQGERWLGEVVGFDRERTLIMLLTPGHVRYGDEVVGIGEQASVVVGPELLGRVIDAQGKAIDGKGSMSGRDRVCLYRSVPSPFERLPIKTMYVTGIRAIDGMLSMGDGQRVGIFGGSGVGKSTIINMLAKGCSERVCVIALVGERGREVLEMAREHLSATAMLQSVLVVATSDQSPLLKLRAAESATTIAEYFQAQGKNVLLIIDSLTRYAMAAREIGLANGEPPTNKGYTPSVFSKLARLVERAGRFQQASITAIYTVLMEGDDQEDPIVDAIRSFLDGHIILSRELAMDGWYPPIDVLSSVSRLMPEVVDDQHAANSKKVRQAMAIFKKSEDLVRIGAYKKGADLGLDEAILLRPKIRAFLEQGADETATISETLTALNTLTP